MYNKKTWTNRLSEYINRRTLTKSDGSKEVVTVERNEGDIIQQGDAFSAETMNDLEDRLEDGFDEKADLTDLTTLKTSTTHGGNNLFLISAINDWATLNQGQSKNADITSESITLYPNSANFAQAYTNAMPLDKFNLVVGNSYYFNYECSGYTGSPVVGIDFFNSSKTIFSSVSFFYNSDLRTFSVPANAQYFRILFRADQNKTQTSGSVKFYNMILAEKESAYEPWIPSVKMLADDALNLKMLGYTIPKECPIKNYIGENGEFVQTVCRVDLGGLAYTKSRDGAFVTYDASLVNSAMSKKGGAEVYLDGYVAYANSGMNWDTWYADTTKKSIILNPSNISSTKQLIIHNPSYTDTSTFKNSLVGQYLYFELATPITTQIDGNEEDTIALNERYMLDIDGFISPTIGTLKNYYDENAKKYHRKIKRVDLGSLTWTILSSCFVSNYISPAGSVGTYGGSNNVVCSKYTAKSVRKYTDSYNDGECGLSVDGKQIIVKDSSYTDASAFKSAMSGKYIYYELETEEVIDVLDFKRSVDADTLGGKAAGSFLLKTESNPVKVQETAPSDTTSLWVW